MGRKILEQKIRLKDDGYSTEPELIVKSFEKKNLLRPDLLYTAVDGSRTEVLKLEGTYRRAENKDITACRGNYNRIFAFTQEQLRQGDAVEGGQGLDIFLDKYPGSAAIVLWNKNKFKRLSNDGEGDTLDYEFLDPLNKPSAIERIVHVELPTFEG